MLNLDPNRKLSNSGTQESYQKFQESRILRRKFKIFQKVKRWVIAKFPVELHAFFPFFRHSNVPHAKLSHRKLKISTGGQRYSTGGPPMAIDGILNNLVLTFPTDGQVLTINGHRWVQWNCHGHR